MQNKLIPPKYLTKELAEKAVPVALAATMGPSPIATMMKRHQCHIVVLVPAVENIQDTLFPECPDYLTQPYLLYEYRLGFNKWEHNYEKIAKNKSLQCWTGRNDEKHGVVPHLLFPGDTPYWGTVKRQGIVVACSGVQPWFDRLIAGIVADTLIALAHDAYENDPERQDVDFLK